MKEDTLLYQKVVHIAEDYFGPAAPRYIGRLVQNHFGKTPDQLTQKDMPELIEWTRLTIAMLTEDQVMVEEFTDRLALVGR